MENIYQDVYCVDCEAYRRQRLKIKNYGGSHQDMYVCPECGCENCEDIEEE